MRTAKFYFTRKAVEDLSSIWDYTAQEWSEAQADRYYRTLIAACRKIAENPVLYGRRYNEVAEDLYGCKTNRHIVFYRTVTDGRVEIVRILHERMDLRRQIG